MEMASGASQLASKRRSLLSRLKLARDYRENFPLRLTRFIGYRPPGQEPPHEPIAAFKWLKRVSLEYEIWVLAWIGAFGGILLIEAIMSSSTVQYSVMCITHPQSLPRLVLPPCCFSE